MQHSDTDLRRQQLLHICMYIQNDKFSQYLLRLLFNNMIVNVRHARWYVDIISEEEASKKKQNIILCVVDCDGKKKKTTSVFCAHIHLLEVSTARTVGILHKKKKFLSSFACRIVDHYSYV